MNLEFKLRLLRSLCAAPLLIHPRFLAGITALLMDDAAASAAAHSHRPLAAASDGKKPWDDYGKMTVTPAGTAIIPMKGMLYAGLDEITAWYFGLCQPEMIQLNAEQALADPKIKAVIIDSDTPGGVTTQIAETAESIAALSRAKLTVTNITGMCCSAGYWIASQTRHITAAGSSDVGCVGTYAAWYDLTRMYQMRGIDLKLFKAGKHKAMGIAGNPLTEEDCAFLQEDVDRINAGFIAAVQSARPHIARDDLEGQWFDGATATAKGFADSISPNLRAVLRQLDF